MHHPDFMSGQTNSFTFSPSHLKLRFIHNKSTKTDFVLQHGENDGVLGENTEESQNNESSLQLLIKLQHVQT